MYKQANGRVYARAALARRRRRAISYVFAKFAMEQEQERKRAMRMKVQIKGRRKTTVTRKVKADASAGAGNDYLLDQITELRDELEGLRGRVLSMEVSRVGGRDGGGRKSRLRRVKKWLMLKLGGEGVGGLTWREVVKAALKESVPRKLLEDAKAELHTEGLITREQPVSGDRRRVVWHIVVSGEGTGAGASADAYLDGIMKRR